MLIKRDILTLKKQMRKDTCSVRRIAGAVFERDGEKLTEFNDTFLNLPDEEFFKFLKIADTVLSKKVNDELLDIRMVLSTKNTIREILDRLQVTDLQDEEMRDMLYKKVMECFHHDGRFMILLYNDVYDIIHENKEDSEEVYSYIICAVCPIDMEQPALSYDEKTNAVISRKRDWIISAPTDAFIYPAFIENHSDATRMMYYTSTPKEPNHEMMTTALECMDTESMTEIRNKFEKIVFKHVTQKELAEKYLARINASISAEMEINELDAGIGREIPESRKKLSNKNLEYIMQINEVPAIFANHILKDYEENFGSDGARLDYLTNPKFLKQAEALRKDKKIADLMEAAAVVIAHNLEGETELTRKLREKVKEMR